MMKIGYTVVTVLVTAFLMSSVSQSEEKENKQKVNDMKSGNEKPLKQSYMELPFLTIQGDETNLSTFKGNVILLVNVASRCGYTKQYAPLEELYNKFKDSGLVVIGFPANNFGGQEPGSNEEILNFCTSKFNVSFPMMAKVSVKGEDKHPLFAYLTEQSNMPGEIGWNFSKFLLDREGNLINRFDTKVDPLSDEIVNEIKKLL